MLSTCFTFEQSPTFLFQMIQGKGSKQEIERSSLGRKREERNGFSSPQDQEIRRIREGGGMTEVAGSGVGVLGAAAVLENPSR